MEAIHNCRIGAWQRRFIRELLKTVFALRGWVNFTNMARYLYRGPKKKGPGAPKRIRRQD